MKNNEQDYRIHGFIRPTPATETAFQQLDELRAELAATTDTDHRIALRTHIGQLTQEIRKAHMSGGK